MPVLNRCPSILLPRGLMLLALLAPVPLSAQTLITDPATCARRAFAAPNETLPLALSWEEAGGGNAARHCVALALMARGDHALAGARLVAIAEDMVSQTGPIGPDDPGAVELIRIHAQAAQAFQAAGDTLKALQQNEAALALAPAMVALHIDRAVIAGEAGNYEQALQALDQAATLAPKRAEIWLFRAGALRSMGLPAEARIEIDHALTLAPNDPAILLERGAILRALGDVSGARADWQAVQRLDAGGVYADEATANLSMVAK